jgi:hypothetical protein
MAISMQQALGELSAAFAGVSVTSREVGVCGLFWWTLLVKRSIAVHLPLARSVRAAARCDRLVQYHSTAGNAQQMLGCGWLHTGDWLAANRVAV